MHFKQSVATVMNPNPQTDQIHPLKSPKVDMEECTHPLVKRKPNNPYKTFVRNNHIFHSINVLPPKLKLTV